MNRLVLVDGNAVLHRAYHALPPLTDPSGTIVNAVYGFTAMIIRLFNDLKPTHVAVAFDRPKPTFRKELYKEYQATRPKMDDDLVPQIARVHDVITAMGIPIFEMDGFEADDVIGTICKKVGVKEKTSIDQVIIVTGDRDILQLVEDEKVLVYMPTKGLSEARLYGEKETVERMGVTPQQIPDFKALAGDSSDHYPGVPGIGPKTAVSILSQFGTIENLYKKGEKGKWGDISGGTVEKLIEGKDSALLSHNLATIRQDVPIDMKLVALKRLDTLEAVKQLEALGFRSLIKRLGNMEHNGKKDNNKEEKLPEDNSEQLSLV